LNQHIENLALGVDCAPQIPIDLQIDFAKMPSRVRFRAALDGCAAIIGPKLFTQRRTVS